MTGIAPHTRATAKRLRANMTPQERQVWRGLRDLNRSLGTHFRRQAPIGRFIADFADYGRRLVVELDGGHHGGAEDQARDEFLAGQGFRVLRFWNSEVTGNLDGLLQRVLDVLGVGGRGSPSPDPSPQGGGGRVSPDGSSGETGGPDMIDPVANGRLVGSILSPTLPPFGRADKLRPEGQR